MRQRVLTFKPLSSVALGCLLAFACTDSGALTWERVETLIADTFPTVKHITTVELSALLENGDKAIIILDAREHAEYSVSHLQNAHYISMDLERALNAVKAQPDAVVVTYCSVGYRSAQLAQFLQQAGHKNVLNLEGSLFKWASEGRPVFRDDTLVQEVHPFDETWGALLPENFWSYGTS